MCMHACTRARVHVAWAQSEGYPVRRARSFLFLPLSPRFCSLVCSYSSPLSSANCYRVRRFRMDKLSDLPRLGPISFVLFRYLLRFLFLPFRRREINKRTDESSVNVHGIPTKTGRHLRPRSRNPVAPRRSENYFLRVFLASTRETRIFCFHSTSSVRKKKRLREEETKWKTLFLTFDALSFRYDRARKCNEDRFRDRFIRVSSNRSEHDYE